MRARAALLVALLCAACGGGDTITVDLEVRDLRDPDAVFVGNAELDLETDENDEPVFIFVGTFDCPYDPLVVRSERDGESLVTYSYQPFCGCEDDTGAALVREHARIEIDTGSIGSVPEGACFYEAPQ